MHNTIEIIPRFIVLLINLPVTYPYDFHQLNLPVTSSYYFHQFYSPIIHIANALSQSLPHPSQYGSYIPLSYVF